MENARMVGAYVPQPFSEKINAFCFAKQTTRSKLLRKMMEDWFESNPVDDCDLANLIVQKFKYDWEFGELFETKDNTSKTDKFNQFLNECNTKMKQNGISDKMISIVLSQLKNYATDQNK